MYAVQWSKGFRFVCPNKLNKTIIKHTHSWTLEGQLFGSRLISLCTNIKETLFQGQKGLISSTFSFEKYSSPFSPGPVWWVSISLWPSPYATSQVFIQWDAVPLRRVYSQEMEVWWRPWLQGRQWWSQLSYVQTSCHSHVKEQVFYDHNHIHKLHKLINSYLLWFCKYVLMICIGTSFKIVKNCKWLWWIFFWDEGQRFIKLT